MDLEQFLRVASSIESFWLNFVKLPHRAVDFDQPILLLLVEDNPGDALLFTETIK